MIDIEKGQRRFEKAEEVIDYVCNMPPSEKEKEEEVIEYTPEDPDFVRRGYFQSLLRTSNTLFELLEKSLSEGVGLEVVKFTDSPGPVNYTPIEPIPPEILEEFILKGKEMRENLSEDSPLEDLAEWEGKFLEAVSSLPGLKGASFVRQAQGQNLASFAIAELPKIKKAGKVVSKIPRDLMETLSHSKGDTLKYIEDPEILNNIRERQTEGKLLAGTLEGLSQNTAYFKALTIALGQTLAEQSRLYNTEGSLTGVREIVEERFGSEVKVEEVRPLIIKKKGGGVDIENRRPPYIFVFYEDLASKMRGGRKPRGGEIDPEGKNKPSRGGKDAKIIREYLEELSHKQYLLDCGKDKRGRQILTGVPFLIKVRSFYLDYKEVGCLVCLSPQYSATARGYVSLRPDIIQKLGGPHQKDITMALLDFLATAKGIEKGGKTLRKRKSELLDLIATGKNYKGRPGLREADFQEAVQKIMNTDLISRYTEEEGGTGEIMSVFYFNPNYTKGRGELPL